MGWIFGCFAGNQISNSCTQSSQRRLGEAAPTARQSAYRELAPTYPHQVYRLLCSHLRNMASSVDQQSSSHQPKPAPSILVLSNFILVSFFKLRERQSPLLARQSTPADIRKRDIEACVLTSSIPAGRCVGALWVAYWACQRYHHLCSSQQLTGTWDF